MLLCWDKHDKWIEQGVHKVKCPTVNQNGAYVWSFMDFGLFSFICTPQPHYWHTVSFTLLPSTRFPHLLSWC